VRNCPREAVTIDGGTQRLLGVRVAAVEKSGGHSHHPRSGPRGSGGHASVTGSTPVRTGLFRETYNDSVGVRVKKDQSGDLLRSRFFLSIASGFLAATERVPGANGNDGNRTVPFPGACLQARCKQSSGLHRSLRISA